MLRAAYPSRYVSAGTFPGRPGHVRTVPTSTTARRNSDRTGASQRGIVLPQRATDARRASYAGTAGPLAPLAPPSYDKAQTKKVLKHARAEPMKEVGKAGYNVLVVEGWELTVLRQSERYRIKVVYHARPAVAQSDLMGERECGSHVAHRT